MFEDLKEKIQGLIVTALEEAGQELVDLQIRKQGTRLMITLLVDHKHGGITLDECALMNRRACEIIESGNFINESYVVEVSSPGLDRPLRTLKDFSRNLNRRIRVYLEEPVDAKFEYQGTIKEIFEDKIALEISQHCVEIPFMKIRKALQVV